MATLLILGAAYFLFFYGKGNTSFGFDDTNFSIEDTASVDQIYLTRVIKGEEKLQLRLKQQGDNWEINEKYAAFQPRVIQLLSTVHRMRVREGLSEAAQASGLKFMDALHTRLDLYAKGKLIKSILVGTQTKDAKGTVMMLNGANTPYVLEIPGIQSYLNVYFPMELDIWRENLLFNGKRDLIKAIHIAYDSLPEVRNLDLLNLDQSPIPQDGGFHKSSSLEAYLTLFKGKVFAETFATIPYPNKLGELKSRTADITFGIDYVDGSSRTVHLYNRPENLNNYFAWIEGQEELLTVQRFVMDKFLQEKADFLND